MPKGTGCPRRCNRAGKLIACQELDSRVRVRLGGLNAGLGACNRGGCLLEQWTVLFGEIESLRDS